MSWISDKQRRWGNSPAGKKALGKKKVDEYNQASVEKKVPEKIKVKPKSMKPRRGK